MCFIVKGPAPDDCAGGEPVYSVYLGQPHRTPHTAVECVQRQEKPGIRD